MDATCRQWAASLGVCNKGVSREGRPPAAGLSSRHHKLLAHVLHRRAMSLKAYRVTGEFWMGHVLSPFTQETVAADATGAKDRVLSTIGSRHRVDRHHITVKDVVELKPDQVTDATIAKRLSMVK